jgi:hypothetical protein
MGLKKNFLPVLLFGSVIGLNEILIGSIKMPYHSVVLSTITLIVLSLARYYLPSKGTSLVITLIAVLFKISVPGIQTCTTASLLCGPAALLLLGGSFEVFASLFISGNPPRYLRFLTTCAVTAVVTFGVFALLQTYVLRSWDQARLMEYTFVRGPLTALASGVLCLPVVYLAGIFRNVSMETKNPYVFNSILGSVVIVMWLLGFYIA